MNWGLYVSLGYQALATYISQRHSLTPSIMVLALQTVIRGLKIHQRATTVKLIHGWVPTYGDLCRQGRAHESICPRCKSTVETQEHVLMCPSPSAVESGNLSLQQFLRDLLNIGTPLFLTAPFEYKLMLSLHIPIPSSHSMVKCESMEVQNTLWIAICHQNTIGWDNFLRGYTSQYWALVYQLSHQNSPLDRFPRIGIDTHQFDLSL